VQSPSWTGGVGASLVAVKDFVNRVAVGSDNLTELAATPLYSVHGVDVRSFQYDNPGVEEVDMILLVGTNPQHLVTHGHGYTTDP